MVPTMTEVMAKLDTLIRVSEQTFELAVELKLAFEKLEARVTKLEAKEILSNEQ